MTHQDNQSSWGSFILGCLVGAGVGATVAFFKAPQSGEQTRRQLQHAMGEVRKEADNVVSTAKDHIQEAGEEISRHAADIKAEGEAAFKKTKQVLG